MLRPPVEGADAFGSLLRAYCCLRHTGLLPTTESGSKLIKGRASPRRCAQDLVIRPTIGDPLMKPTTISSCNRPL
jgi:hypothetical protein